MGKTSDSKVLCARTGPELWQPVHQLRDQSGQRVSDIIRAGLREQLGKVSGAFQRQAVQELEKVTTVKEAEAVAIALMETTQTKEEAKFVEKAAIATVEALSLVPSEKPRNWKEEVTRAFAKVKSEKEHKEVKRFLESQAVSRNDAKIVWDMARESLFEIKKLLAKKKKNLPKPPKAKKAPKAKKPKAKKEKITAEDKQKIQHFKERIQKEALPDLVWEAKRLQATYKGLTPKGKLLSTKYKAMVKAQIAKLKKKKVPQLPAAAQYPQLPAAKPLQAAKPKKEKKPKAEKKEKPKKANAGRAEKKKPEARKKAARVAVAGKSCSIPAPVLLGSKTGGGIEKVPATYCLLEVEEALTSHKPLSGFGERAGYPKDAQERDYFHDKYEQFKVAEIARQYEPSLIFNSNPGAMDGVPIVNQENVVLGGNGRTMATALVYGEGKETAGQLKRYLATHAKSFGFTPKQIQSLEHPMIVRRIQTGAASEELAAWSRRFNESMSKKLDKTTMAQSRGRFVGKEVILALHLPEDETLSAWLASEKSLPFVRKLQSTGVLDARNAAEYINVKTGLLNQAGRDMVRELLLAVLVPDATLLSALGTGATYNTLEAAAPYLLEMKTWGETPFDISGALVSGLRELVSFRASAYGSAESYLRSKGDVPPIAALWLQVFEKLYQSPAKLTKVARYYVDAARGPAMGQVSLFASESRTPYQILEAGAKREGVKV